VWIPPLPQRFQWDHNAHYHRWLLGQLPDRAATALDIGCGDGALVRLLSDRVDQIDGIDVSADMIDRARAQSVSNARWLVGDVLDPDVDLRRGGYDVVTAVSSLHHMPLREGLDRMTALVRPGGVLVVVGLYRQATLADRAMEVVTLPANAAVGVALAARGRAGKPHDECMPIQEATTTLAELRAAAESLPGASLRRRMFWRYSLVWRRG
jgi:SAM-dependent methyltransferase